MNMNMNMNMNMSQSKQRSMTDDTEIHYRSDTMVEHKEESALVFDRMSQTNSSQYQKRERQGTVDTVASIETVNTINTMNQQGSMSPHNAVNTIPENSEIALISHIDQLQVNQKSDDNDDNDNQLNDDNIDDNMYSYNKRPILFVLISIIIIYVPILANYDIVYIFYIHLIYLLINLIIFIILIPLYSKCIPESTDSIISNGGKLLNRRPPIRYHKNDKNHNNIHNIHNINNNDEDDDDDEFVADDSMEIEHSNSCHILYSFDAFYNRFFNIRNISYDVGDNVVNFDSKIYNLIAIPFAGGFLILSNIILLICYSVSDESNESNESNHILFIMRNQLTFLIISSTMIVALTLFCQISVHFTQIKDDQRKSIGNDIYVTRLESNVQNLTEKRIFHKTLTQKIIYGMTLILSVIFWIIYYEIYNTESYQSSFATNFNLFILMLYTIILIHLVFRLLILYNYAIIIVKQFSFPIGVKSMHQVITYWKLRRYYIDLVLYAFISLFNRILSGFLLFIAITLIYIYAKIEMFEYSESNIPSNYLPIFIIIVYIMFATLYTLNMASNIHILQLKHAQMLNREKIYFKHFQFVQQFNDEMKKVMKSDDIISLINDIQHNILNSSQYQIAGIIINNTTDVLIRFVFIIFAIIIYSYFV